MPEQYLKTLDQNFYALVNRWSATEAAKNWQADQEMLRLLSAELAEREIPLALPCGL